MEVFIQQLINGITLGSIYGLIAIGYTMVFGILGMVNFAHGDVFMVSAFIALIAFLILTAWIGTGAIALALLIVLIIAMVMTSLVNWAIERVAYRPLRGSFRLAPLISAIGMSIFLMNFVQVAQGPRNKSIPPLFSEVIVLFTADGYDVTVSYKQIVDLAGDRRAAARVLVPGVEDRARPRAARLRAGPEDGGAGRHQCRPHHLDHLRHRGGARRGRRHHVPRPLRRRELRRRLHARRQGVHRRRARRHRLAAGRGDRRPRSSA